MKKPEKKRRSAKREVPGHFRQFVADYPEVASHYHELSKAVRSIGALNEKTSALIKLGIAVGLKHEGAVHAHTRKSLDAGATKDEIRQTVILSLTTIGFPSMMAALTWVNDILEDR